MTQCLRDIMTKNVATVQPHQSIAEAAKIMEDYNVGAVPVVENGQCVGMITDRDITVRAVAGHMDHNARVNSIMTKNILTASANTTVHEAADMMARHQIRRLPVVDNNEVAGIVALGDLAIENIYENEAGEALANISEQSPGQG